MEVMCVKPIDSSNWLTDDYPRPEVGDKDNVIEEVTLGPHLYYCFARFGRRHGYRSTHFAILPDQSADQMNDEQREAIIYQR